MFALIAEPRGGGHGRALQGYRGRHQSNHNWFAPWFGNVSGSNFNSCGTLTLAADAKAAFPSLRVRAWSTAKGEMRV